MNKRFWLILFSALLLVLSVSIIIFFWSNSRDFTPKNYLQPQKEKDKTGKETSGTINFEKPPFLKN